MKSTLDEIAKSMTHEVRKAEVRGILKLCLARKEVITYLDLAKPLGMFSGGAELAGILGELMEEAGLCDYPLSTLVVRADTSLPGSGYFEMARKMGFTIGQSPKDEEHFWQDQMVGLGIFTPAHVAQVRKHQSEDDEDEQKTGTNLNPCRKCHKLPASRGLHSVAPDESMYARGCTSLCQDDSLGETQDQADANWNKVNPPGRTPRILYSKRAGQEWTREALDEPES